MSNSQSPVGQNEAFQQMGNMRVLGEEEKYRKGRKLFEKIMIKGIPKLMKIINPQIQ